MNKLLRNIQGSNFILREAVGSHGKTVAYKLREVGKRATPSAVEKWFVETVSDIVRANWLATTKRNLYAIFEATPAGFEVVLNDLEIFVRELRRKKRTPHTVYALPHPIRSEVESITVTIQRELSKLGILCEETV